MLTKEEKAFREGLQDNTVRLDDPDPKPSVTNNDQHVTNEDDQQIITDEVDDHEEPLKQEEESREREDVPGTAAKKQDISNMDAENFPAGTTGIRPPE